MSELLTTYLRRFRRQAGLADSREVADCELLQRFAHSRDEDAFASLLHRHGPLVFGVCSRILRQGADAEDAFQATFLVLARKAGAIGQPERLGNWLYGVASRIALKARVDAARRSARQQSVTEIPARQREGEADWEDLRQVLDEEMQHLPDKFRVPLVLCYLRGMTREEAADRLGSSPGAVKGMLERGREHLRSRLARRGVSLSAGSLAALLAENALAAEVPAGLMGSTVQAALVFVAGSSTTNAAILAQGIMQSMLISRLNWWLAVVLMLSLTGAGVGMMAVGGRSDVPAIIPNIADPKVEEKADPLKRFAAARLDAAKTAYATFWARFEIGRGSEDAVHLWSRRWLQAKMDLSAKKSDRDNALADYQERLKKTDEIARRRLSLVEFPEADHRFDKNAEKKFESEQDYFETMWKAYQNRDAGEEQVCQASVRWLIERHHAINKDKDDDLKSELQFHLDRVKKVEAIAEQRFKAGVTARAESMTAAFFRTQAEEWLARGKTFERRDPR